MFFNVRIAPVFRIKTRRGVMWKLLLPSYVYSWKLCARTTMSKGSENIRCCGKMCTSRLDLNSSLFKIQGVKYMYIKWVFYSNMSLQFFIFEGNGYNPNIRPIHPGQTANEQGVKDYLRSKGCKCHDTPYLNITSSDSR